MKIKKYLLLGLACVLVGCSDTQDDQEKNKTGAVGLSASDSTLSELPLDQLTSAEYRKFYKHLFSEYYTTQFNPGQPEPSDPTATIALEYGIWNQAAKDLTKTLWSKLQAKGFSGYDPKVLDQTVVRYDFVHEFATVAPKAQTTAPGHKDATDLEMKRFQGGESVSDMRNDSFHTRFLGVLLHDRDDANLRSVAEHNLKQYPFVASLIGLKHDGRVLNLLRSDIKFSNGVERAEYQYALGDRNSTDTIARVSEDQLKAWNDIFLDVLRSDEFFKDFFKPQSADLSAGIGTRSTRCQVATVDARRLTVSGISGYTLPIHTVFNLDLSGYLDGKNTDIKGILSSRLSNTSLGVTYAYSNMLKPTIHGVDQSEVSALIAHNFGPLFVEGQIGSVSKNASVSAARRQLSVGFDLEYVSPFVQVVSHQDAGNTVFLGAEMDLTAQKMGENRVGFTARMKAGYDEYRHQFTGMFSFSGDLNLNEGVSVRVDLNMEPHTSSAGAQFQVSR